MSAVSADQPGADLDPIALVRQLIAIDSVNPDLVPGGAGEGAIAAWCTEWLKAHGFDVRVLEERPNRPSVVGIARGRGDGRSLMLNGHLDTVGVGTWDGARNGTADGGANGTAGGTTVGGANGTAGGGPDGGADAATPDWADAFGGERRDGTIVGRGAFDMKGGLAAILVAAARATADGLAGDVLVTLVADEEFGSLGTEEVLRHYSADAAIVAEPSQLELIVAHRGFAWFEIELSGRPAHGSQPELGVDAIAHAGLVLRALDDLQTQMNAAPAHPLLGYGTVRVSTISGGTDAATVASSCTLTVERRTLPGQTPAQTKAELGEVLEHLAASTPSFAYRLTRLVGRGAFQADPEWPIVRAVSASAARVLERPAATRGEPFWTDAALIQEAGIPCLLIGAAGGGAHAGREWVSEASVLQLTEILHGTIIEFCGRA